ncbi:glycosyltransferase, partial [Vibrio lentus]
MPKLGILCYSLTPSTVDLIERISIEIPEYDIAVFPLVKTEIYKEPQFDYVAPDQNTKYWSLGKNKEENQIVKFNFHKMYSLAKNSDHVLSFGVQSMPCLLLSFFCKLLNTDMTIAHQTMSLFGETNKKNRLVSFLKGLAIHNANYHIAQTPNSTEVLKSVYDVSDDRITNAFWDGGLGSLKSMEGDNVEDIWADYKCLKLIFVGSLIPLKNVPVILKAISEIPNDCDVHLDIIGHDNQFPGYKVKLEKLVTDLGITKKVTFHGRMDIGDIFNFYKNSDVIILPSIKEAWAKVLVEAAYFNTAMITSKVNGQAGYLVNEKSGYILEDHNDSVALSEAILSLY